MQICKTKNCKTKYYEKPKLQKLKTMANKKVRGVESGGVGKTPK
jgi:hypothetical protein